MSKQRTRTDLDISQKYEVVKELEKGISQAKVAEKFGILQSQVCRIKAIRKKNVFLSIMFVILHVYIIQTYFYIR